ncbi:MAG: phosphate signaling complex protein PhoU [Bacteroidales bacterium]|nr:phosphate signaling complex protein PhoU [Bacteroidales bacterium]
MKPFEYEIENIKTLVNEMFDLVKDQVHLTKEALLTSDHDLSGEIMRKEKRVNAYELSVDREIEDFLALQAPVATDLRFAIAILKISASLERIGDHAYRISTLVFDEQLKVNKGIVELLQISTLFDEIDDMLINVSDALEKGEIELAKKVFKQDKTLDKINKKLPGLLDEHYKNKKNIDLHNIILISRVVGKLERVGDLIKNIAEEIIFYYESEVIRHRKKNLKISKKLGEATGEAESEKTGMEE